MTPILLLAAACFSAPAETEQSITVETLPPSHPRETVLRGRAVLHTNVENMFRWIRRIRDFKQGPEVLQTGFLEDLPKLRLPESEFRSIAGCRPGDCGIRLSRSSIARRSQGVRPETVLEDEVLLRIQAYRRGGHRSLQPYADKPQDLDPAAEAHEMARAAASFFPEAPEFAALLAGYPAVSIPGVESTLYWSVDKIGPKPVLSVTHLLLYRKGETLLVAARQIYASHYFDGSLSLSRIRPWGPNRALLEYENRSRSGMLDGMFSKIRRGLIEEAARRAAERYLHCLQTRSASEPSFEMTQARD